MTEGWEAEDPFDAEDWEGEFEPSGFLRRRPKFVRAVGVVTAVSLLLGTVGTAIDFLLQRSTTNLFATSVNSVEPAGATPLLGATSGFERVAFSVASGAGSNPVCAVTVLYNRRIVGGVVTRPAGARTGSRAVDVSVSRAPFSGTPADASVVCAADLSNLESSGAG